MNIMRENILKIKTPLIGGELKKKFCCQPTTFQMIGASVRPLSVTLPKKAAVCFILIPSPLVSQGLS